MVIATGSAIATAMATCGTGADRTVWPNLIQTLSSLMMKKNWLSSGIAPQRSMRPKTGG